MHQQDTPAQQLAESDARRARRLEIRWSLPGDEAKIIELVELNDMPRWVAFEERFIVAESKGEVLAALTCKMESKRLRLGPVIADPWTEERPLAAALYAGVRDLAREMGADEVLARRVPYADYPHQVGYLPWGRWWWLGVIRSSGPGKMLAGGWRWMFSLLSRGFAPKTLRCPGNLARKSETHSTIYNDGRATGR